MEMSLFAAFRGRLLDVRVPAARHPAWLMHEEGGTEVYYLPFEYINPSAKVVLVGITPGKTRPSAGQVR